ncbi:DMT family transporter [Tomitella gaofuii]|uniref:DMT family transporter n=1 Tax=Tomitella gaofuii TaxID=2760083 RepID=UPI0015F95D1C|nr:DMT family transporter [Tomitella gaofuii]
MLVYVLALLTAVANASASVLQRAANRKRPADELFHPRLIIRVLREPLWFAGIAALIISFFLLAGALGSGPISIVEPLVVLTLPLTLVIADITFGRHTRPAEWGAAAAITVGLVGVLFFLAPEAGPGALIPVATWAWGLGAAAACIAVLVVLAARAAVGSMVRPALLGVATGIGFGTNAALIKAMTAALERGGWAGLATTWQTYGVVVCGALAFFLLQAALGSGPLIAAQPGLTGAEPIVSILWGTIVFGEQVRGGLFYIGTGVSAAIMAAGIIALTRAFAAAVEPEGIAAAVSDDRFATRRLHSAPNPHGAFGLGDDLFRDDDLLPDHQQFPDADLAADDEHAPAVRPVGGDEEPRGVRRGAAGRHRPELEPD